MGKKQHWSVAGFAKREDGTSAVIISGKDIFRFIDSSGFPFELLCDALRKEALGFDVYGFCEAAMHSPNYTWKRLQTLLKESCPSQAQEDLAKVFLTIERRFLERVTPKEKARIWDL